MRAAILVISVAACTKADQDRPLPAPPAPAVAPVDPQIARDAELATLAPLLERAGIHGCNLRVETSSSGLRNERNIPLDQVTWKLDANWEKRPTANATCTKPQCIHGKGEGRTLDIPHEYSWRHYEADTDFVFIVGGDPAKVIAKLERAGRICKRS